ncbi:hypothetical protein [Candidatus Competibacter phosphatis]|uniref:hypothetical protein n=1 Tax=Candidatus Competibacter phosphatis TaxID=221280 RepID=UPI0028A87618|nr:hypothetical protein [Candidatus Competibacter phosphatis]
MQLTFVDRLVVKTPHLDWGQLGQLARQIFDVNAGAPVNVGGGIRWWSAGHALLLCSLGRAGGGNWRDSDGAFGRNEFDGELCQAQHGF